MSRNSSFKRRSNAGARASTRRTQQGPYTRSRAAADVVARTVAHRLRAQPELFEPELTELQRRSLPPRSPSLDILIAAGQRNQSTNARSRPPSRPEQTTIEQQLLQIEEDSEEAANSHMRRVSFDKAWQRYRTLAQKACARGQIFTVYGDYPIIRKALVRRGWAHKLPPDYLSSMQRNTEYTILGQAQPGNDWETVAISQAIGARPANFIWGHNPAQLANVEAGALISRIERQPHLNFTTKIGLIGCSEQSWYKSEGQYMDACMDFPRFYRLGDSEQEREAFRQDYQLTQCLSLLRYICDQNTDLRQQIDVDRGRMQEKHLAFALQQIKKHVDGSFHITVQQQLQQQQQQQHSNTALRAKERRDEEYEWSDFLEVARAFIQNRAKIRASTTQLDVFMATAIYYLNQVEVKHPNWRWDGYKNLWILKPAYFMQGRGIDTKSDIKEILKFAADRTNKKYIVQKYIERPLLIYRTKFDLRQYMLLTIGEKFLTMWTYKDCYLRFSSQEYSLENLNEAIHLTNHYVQKQYKNQLDRDVRLPSCNMWSLDDFQKYLAQERVSRFTWDNIFEGMRCNMLGVILAGMPGMSFVPNTFELFGFDFMLDEGYNPILIEVNSNPDLSLSTCVTTRICPKVQEDLLRVVLDLRTNPRANTGNFKKSWQIDYKEDFLKKHKNTSIKS